MRIDSFVVAPARHTDFARTSFVLAPKVNVIAFAHRNSFGSSANALSRNATAALDYVELGCSVERVASVPGLAQFDSAPNAPYSAARLIASVRMANLRLHSDEFFRSTEVATSISALHAEGSLAVLITCGPDAEAWIVRRGELVTLVARVEQVWPTDDASALLGAVEAFEAREWVGRRAQIALDAQQVVLEPGDIVGLGAAEPAVIDQLRAGAPIDRVLAFFAGDGGPLCVLGRVTE